MTKGDVRKNSRECCAEEKKKEAVARVCTKTDRMYSDKIKNGCIMWLVDVEFVPDTYKKK